MITPKQPKMQPGSRNSASPRLGIKKEAEFALPGKPKPKKMLGQHFLMDSAAITNLVEAISPKKGELIIEIGSGHGELTRELLAVSLKLLEETGVGLKIIGIEKDHKLAVSLKLLAVRERLESQIEIIEGDILQILPQLSENYSPRSSSGGAGKLKAISYKLVGNIPYYITGHLFRIVGELKHKPSLMVFTIQKEVAERICAGKGKMNILAASIQIWGEPEIVRLVDRKSFYPVPKVDSAVLRLTAKSYKLKAVDMQKYYRFLHVIFKQPRKTILNNLKQLTLANGKLTTDKIIEVLIKNGVDPQSRPQDLTVDDLKRLSKQIL